MIIKVKLKAEPTSGDRKRIFEIPGALRIKTGIYHFSEALDGMDSYRKGEEYDVYADENGNSPYIEAEIKLYQKFGEEKIRTMTLGLPLNLFDALLFRGTLFLR